MVIQHVDLLFQRTFLYNFCTQFMHDFILLEHCVIVEEVTRGNKVKREFNLYPITPFDRELSEHR